MRKQHGKRRNAPWALQIDAGTLENLGGKYYCSQSDPVLDYFWSHFRRGIEQLDLVLSGLREGQRSSHMREGPGKEVDVALLVFIERYANDLLKWDLISLFARNPDLYDTPESVAGRVGRNPRVVRPELVDLAMLGVLEWDCLNGDQFYYLTRQPEIRKLALKFAQHLNGS